MHLSQLKFMFVFSSLHVSSCDGMGQHSTEISAEYVHGKTTVQTVWIAQLIPEELSCETRCEKERALFPQFCCQSKKDYTMALM